MENENRNQNWNEKQKYDISFLLFYISLGYIILDRYMTPYIPTFYQSFLLFLFNKKNYLIKCNMFLLLLFAIFKKKNNPLIYSS